MSTRIMGFMTLVVLGGMALILLLNMTRLFTATGNERYLSYNGVKGMAVDYHKKLWTLNFDQQNQAIEAINRALPIGKSEASEKKAPFERIVVYRFNGPDLFVTPIGYDGDNLILQCKEWNPNGYLLDVTGGSFDSLLRSSYDP